MSYSWRRAALRDKYECTKAGSMMYRCNNKAGAVPICVVRRRGGDGMKHMLARTWIYWNRRRADAAPTHFPSTSEDRSEHLSTETCTSTNADCKCYLLEYST